MSKIHVTPTVLFLIRYQVGADTKILLEFYGRSMFLYIGLEIADFYISLPERDIMKKVLIITYYWPPSGGAGVQRWLKFTRYLPAFGIEPVVLTVDPSVAGYPQRDSTLEAEVPGNIMVYRTRTRELYNVYKFFSGKKEIPYGGFANEEGRVSLFQWLARTVRGNLLLPDPRRGWNRYAFRKAVELIHRYDIKTVVTTGPPHSTQLIGLKLKKKTGVRWIADFRDPWTDIFYYSKFNHSALAKMIDRRLERSVLTAADRVITVSHNFRRLLAAKTEVANNDNIFVIPNGYDEEDFRLVEPPAEEVDGQTFVITYSGTISAAYYIDGFLDALSSLSPAEQATIRLRFVGQVPQVVTDKIKDRAPAVATELIGYVDHLTAVAYLLRSSMQLLIIPRVDNNEGILPGKVFEYMASGRNILAIGPRGGDLEQMITEVGCGKLFGYEDNNAMTSFLKDAIAGKVAAPDPEKIKPFSRRRLTEELASLLHT